MGPTGPTGPGGAGESALSLAWSGFTSADGPTQHGNPGFLTPGGPPPVPDPVWYPVPLAKTFTAFAVYLYSAVSGEDATVNFDVSYRVGGTGPSLPLASVQFFTGDLAGVKLDTGSWPVAAGDTISLTASQNNTTNLYAFAATLE